MCKAYYSYHACGCITPLIVIDRCHAYVHANPGETCMEMILRDAAKIAVVTSDLCADEPTHADLPNSEAERRGRVPCEKVFGRYITNAELEGMEKIELLIKPEMYTQAAAVLPLDAFQSLADGWLEALPTVEDEVPEAGDKAVDAFKSFRGMQGALPMGT